MIRQRRALAWEPMAWHPAQGDGKREILLSRYNLLKLGIFLNFSDYFASIFNFPGIGAVAVGDVQYWIISIILFRV
ncbi:hypothetical protein [Chromobacterium sphagni]|uniref:hypothetical protein n=1 Tax=Chromobacterium sphagni TaxID=1903179 RepID=UPI00111364C9|nr:hypothetical protein [Chromobacterium sphagni]